VLRSLIAKIVVAFGRIDWPDEAGFLSAGEDTIRTHVLDGLSAIERFLSSVSAADD
jgi:hypothetical protein